MKIADMHCDTIVRMYEENQMLDKNSLHIDLKKMKKGDYLLQNMAIFLDSKKEKDMTNKARDIIKFYNQQTQMFDVNRVYKYSDIDFNKINTMLCIEDSEIVPYENLEEFYNLGIRMITLTWNYPNKVGYPNLDANSIDAFDDLYRVDDANGLSEYGKKYIKKMEDLKIIVDVSHTSNKVVEDVLSLSSKPFVASHSNAFSISPVGRNINDKLLLKMFDKECVIGLNLLTEFINDKESVSKIDDLIKHVDHLLDIGGENSIGFGCDFDGIGSTLEIKDSSNIQWIIDAFNKRYNKNTVRKIAFENVLSLYEKVLK